MRQEMTGYNIVIASPPEYEELVAEIYFDGNYIAQLNKENGDDHIELEIADAVVDQSMVCRKVDLNGFLEALEIARTKLVVKKRDK